jgi:hypothetical protein
MTEVKRDRHPTVQVRLDLNASNGVGALVARRSRVLRRHGSSWLSGVARKSR